MPLSSLHQMVLKLWLCSRHNFSPGNPEGADKPRKSDSVPSTVDWRTGYDQVLDEVGDDCHFDLKRKKMISMPLMMENPVRRPMVPPMRLSWASVLIFFSLSMLSKVAVSK